MYTGVSRICIQESVVYVYMRQSYMYTGVSRTRRLHESVVYVYMSQSYAYMSQLFSVILSHT
jgi:hypothetical protein